MADLVVIGYPDEATAERAFEVVSQLEPCWWPRSW